MKALVSLLAIALLATAAQAADETPAGEKKLTAQQAKMKNCNAEAREKALKGDERKAFMKECLSAKPTKTAQQDKMKVCSKEASDKALKGDERKAFMSDCLRAEAQ